MSDFLKDPTQSESLKSQLESYRNSCDIMSANFERAIQLSYNLIKAFHPILGLQSRSINKICRLIRDSGYLNEEEYHVLMISSWIQNVGLVSISRELLNKAMHRPHDMEEHERMRLSMHPIIGEQLANFTGYLSLVGKTIRSTQEHWDGSGHPDGLAGSFIPRPARFLAIAVFYIESYLSAHEAIEEIINLSGTVFEPEAVRLFLKTSEEVELPHKVKELLFSELKPGLRLAHPITTPNGLLLFPADKELDSESFQKVVDYNNAEPIRHRILVYRED